MTEIVYSPDEHLTITVNQAADLFPILIALRDGFERWNAPRPLATVVPIKSPVEEDPTLAILINAAESVAEIKNLYRQYETEWTPEHSELAAARKVALEREV